MKLETFKTSDGRFFKLNGLGYASVHQTGENRFMWNVFCHKTGIEKSLCNASMAVLDCFEEQYPEAKVEFIRG